MGPALTPQRRAILSANHGQQAQVAILVRRFGTDRVGVVRALTWPSDVLEALASDASAEPRRDELSGSMTRLRHGPRAPSMCAAGPCSGADWV